MAPLRSADSSRSFRAVVRPRNGGREALHVVELPPREPGPGDVRICMTAAGVGATDLLMLAGSYGKINLTNPPGGG